MNLLACPRPAGNDPLMQKVLIALASLLLTRAVFAADVLIVADEFPAMKILANALKAQENLDSRIVSQAEMPADLAPYKAVIVYIHRNLNEAAEKAFIRYTEAGGRLVPLHHSISSGKRKNKEWFKFLGVSLPQGDVSQGGYKWIEGVVLSVVNLASDHFITTHKVNYPEQIAWTAGAGEGQPKRPGFTLQHSEVYLNHVLTEPRQLLLGFKYTDATSGQVYEQKHAGWMRKSGKGWIVYLMPGHSLSEFEDPAYARIVVNAVIWQPDPQ